MNDAMNAAVDAAAAVGTAKGRKGLRQLADGVQAAFLTVVLDQDVLLGGRQQSQPFLRNTSRPHRPVESVEQGAADLVLFQHDRHRFVLTQRRPPHTPARGVGGQGCLEVLGQPQVVHHQTVRLVLEDPINAADGLHQPVAPHRLVNIHSVQAGSVEPGEPHVSNQHNLEWVGGIAEAVPFV